MYKDSRTFRRLEQIWFFLSQFLFSWAIGSIGECQREPCFMIYILTFNCQTSKIITLSELRDKLTSSTSKSYRRQKFDYTKIAACLFCRLNSNQLQWWFSFSYIYYVCSVYNYKKSSIHKKLLLIIFTMYLYVFSMLSQLKHNGFFILFR